MTVAVRWDVRDMVETSRRRMSGTAVPALPLIHLWLNLQTHLDFPGRGKTQSSPIDAVEVDILRDTHHSGNRVVHKSALTSTAADCRRGSQRVLQSMDRMKKPIS